MNVKRLRNWMLISLVALSLITCTQQEEIVPPTACFSISQINSSSNTGIEVQFDNCSEHSEQFSWNFGDGYNSNEQNPSHTFSEPDFYEIQLVVINKYITDRYTYYLDLTDISTNSPLSITTKSITNIGTTQAESGGNIINNNNTSISVVGVCWSENNTPTIDDYYDVMYYSTNSYNIELTNLEPSTTYNVRAFAITIDEELYYGNILQFTTDEEEEIVAGTNQVIINKTNTAPVIDGVIDEIWASCEAQAINTPFDSEKVSYNGVATWKATWDDDNIYVLVEVPDDDFYPFEEASTDSWMADKPEIYFDVNEFKEDGGGPSDADGSWDNGHYQFSPAFLEEYTTCQWAYDKNISEGDDSKAYFVEYAVAFSELLDENYEPLDPYTRKTIGFDVNLIDLDEVGKGATTDTRQRVSWVNEGPTDSWDNMDTAGDLIFSSNEPSMVADFSADATSVTINQPIQFTDLTTKNPTSWYWTFGDGSYSYEQNPSHTYEAAGTYTVELTASNSSETNTRSKLSYITVTNEEKVIFDPATFEGELPEGMEIVTIDNIDYLKIMLNGWGSLLGIPEVDITDNTYVSLDIKFELGDTSIVNGLTLDNITAGVNLMDTINLVDNPWGEGLVSASTSINRNPAPAEFTTITASYTEDAQVYIHNLQFFGQENVTWDATHGDILWIGKITTW